MYNGVIVCFLFFNNYIKLFRRIHYMGEGSHFYIFLKILGCAKRFARSYHIYYELIVSNCRGWQGQIFLFQKRVVNIIICSV